MEKEAKIIVVCNQKGGSGKSTVSLQLSGCLSLHSKKVILIDADPQGTATRWASSAEDDTPFPATVAGLSAAGGKVHREVIKFCKDYDYIVIDCPPAVDSPVPQSALMVANLAIIPIIPSPPDLWASVGIKELISRMADINSSLKSRLLINMLQPNTNISQDVTEVLSDFDISLMETKLHLRTAYRQSAVYGGTVHSVPNSGKAVSEVEMLTKEVISVIGNNG